MKTIISECLRADFESVATRMVESGTTIAGVRDMFVILDGSPEYLERAEDPLCMIFYTFPHAGRVFHVSLD